MPRLCDAVTAFARGLKRQVQVHRRDPRRRGERGGVVLGRDRQAWIRALARGAHGGARRGPLCPGHVQFRREIERRQRQRLQIPGAPRLFAREAVCFEKRPEARIGQRARLKVCSPRGSAQRFGFEPDAAGQTGNGQGGHN